MRDPNQSPGAVDRLLADAHVRAGHRGGPAPTAAERIARAEARARAAAPHPAAAPGRSVSRISGPARETGDRDEDARRELDLTCVQVVGAPRAAAALTWLSRPGASRRVEPDGALVFACLMHLVDRAPAAQFWWQFAAGSGNPAAARCLALHHRLDRNLPDARVWSEQARRLTIQQAEQEGLPVPAGPSAERRPLLPGRIAEQLLQQCEQGLRPRLPSALEQAVHGLVVVRGDEALGEITQPCPELLGALCAQC